MLQTTVRDPTYLALTTSNCDGLVFVDVVYRWGKVEEGEWEQAPGCGSIGGLWRQGISDFKAVEFE